MAVHRLVQFVDNGRLGYREDASDRRVFEVNGRLGYFTPDEIEAELERRRERADLAPAFRDDLNDYDY